MRFTKPIIDRLILSEGKSEMLAFDDALPGFGYRIRAGGKKTWVVQYRLGRKQRRVTIGSAAAMELEEAKKAARRLLAQVGLAIDPQAEKVRAKVDAAVTLGGTLERYLAAKRAVLRQRSFEETSRHLRRDWSPLHGLPIQGIRRADIANLLGELAIKNGSVSADRARASLSAFFSWARREGVADSNPVTATNRPAVPKPRDRVLTDAELASIWNACREDDYGRIVRLLILTGQRRDEVAGITRLEVDAARSIWSLGGNRTKNHRPHEVPLSDLALAVVGEALARADERDHVDGNAEAGMRSVFGRGSRPFSGWSKAKVAIDRRIESSAPGNSTPAGRGNAPKPIGPWRLHDLRRTVATRMADIGVPPHIIEAVLNHVSGTRSGVAGVYNRALYTAEKRAALALWAARVEELVSGRPATVVPLKRA